MFLDSAIIKNFHFRSQKKQVLFGSLSKTLVVYVEFANQDIIVIPRL
jgi:hypothetical protein